VIKYKKVKFKMADSRHVGNAITRLPIDRDETFVVASNQRLYNKTFSQVAR